MSRAHIRLGFQTGLVSGAAAGLVLLGARLALGVPTIPELLLDPLTSLVPPAGFAFVLDRLLFAAKPLMMGGIVVGQLLVGGAGGALLAALTGDPPAPGAGRWRGALALAAAGWLLVGGGLLPAIGAGLSCSRSRCGLRTISA